MKILLFSTGFLLEKEIKNALKKIGGVQLISLRVEQITHPQHVLQVADALKQHRPDMAISINAYGLDPELQIASHLQKLGIVLCNWFVDNPFFYELYKEKQIPFGSHIFHFVSDASYLDQMRAKGWQTHFLPLATDPDVFSPEKGRGVEPKFDVVFVGASYQELISKFIQAEEEKQLMPYMDLIAKGKMLYDQGHVSNLEEWLVSDPVKQMWYGKVPDLDKFMFLVEWYIDYLYRKDVIKALNNQTEFSFMCFGDAYWNKILGYKSNRCSIGYYTNLCETYHSAAINFNLTRTQIRNGFTQRVFDCLASKCFLITNQRPCNRTYFKTSGDGTELIEFKGSKDANLKIHYFLQQPEERQAIAEAGYRKVLESHTYVHRLQEMIRVAGGQR